MEIVGGVQLKLSCFGLCQGHETYSVHGKTTKISSFANTPLQPVSAVTHIIFIVAVSAVTHIVAVFHPLVHYVCWRRHVSVLSGATANSNGTK